MKEEGHKYTDVIKSSFIFILIAKLFTISHLILKACDSHDVKRYARLIVDVLLYRLSHSTVIYAILPRSTALKDLMSLDQYEPFSTNSSAVPILVAVHSLATRCCYLRMVSLFTFSVSAYLKSELGVAL